MTIPTRLALAGVVMIFSGEALCIFGPLKHERIIHIVCHAILYAGIAFAAVAAIAGVQERFRLPK